MTPKYLEWPKDDATCWDEKRAHHLSWPRRALAWRYCPGSCCPAESSWRLSSIGLLKHEPGLNIVRTVAQIQDSGTLRILRKPRLYLLAKALIPIACESSLGWNPPSQGNTLMVKRYPGEGVDCETHPSLSAVAISTAAFELHFQDIWKKPQQKTSGIFTTTV